MKIYFLATALVVTAFLFSYCHSSKKAASKTMEAAKSNYTSSIQTLIGANCSPCHIPAKGGNKKALDTYEAAKTNIDDIIRRIGLNPIDRGFMPFKKPRLSDSTIAVFRQWKTDGLMEN